MKNFTWAAYIGMALSLSSCLCRYMDCEQSDYNLALRIVDKHTDINLLFGPQKMYRSDSLKVYSIDSAGSPKKLVVSSQYDRYYKKDTVLLITVDRHKQLVLQYNSLVSDTITVNTATEKTKCCGMITLYKSITYKGTTFSKQEPYPFELKK